MGGSGIARDARTGVVLSGGGMHGAYEVGVIAGVVEALELRETDPSLFSIFTGSSVGAINAAYLASQAHRGDLGISHLVETWQSLRLHKVLRPRPFGLLRRPEWAHFGHHHDDEDEKRIAGAFLDPAEFERVVNSAVDWEQLHKNVKSGVVDAVVIAALEITQGVTTLFSELTPELKCSFPESDRRVVSRVQIELQHVLASSAIPGLFPARPIGRHYYCDGGLRFNTPMSPAIRSGADRLLVVTLLSGTSMLGGFGPKEGPDCPPPGPLFLLGKVLNALLRDPIEHDLRVLERFNHLASAMDEILSIDDRERIDAVITKARGTPYRMLPTLVFKPSQDLGALAAETVNKFDFATLSSFQRAMLHWALPKGEDEADWASFLWFDGEFARRIIDLGRSDALARTDEIEAFFRGDGDRPSIDH
jgi:NTE family protein